MSRSAAALRIHTNRRQDFDSYFPVEEHEDSQVYHSDYASLPFPAPLTTLRANFRGEEFDCDDFLLEHQRHGQLDDLLLELRGLSTLLDSELIKGVEEDYESFIGLGRMDSRKVDDLKKGVINVVDQLKTIESEAQANLDEIDETLKARRVLRRRKKAARQVLKISMAIDELSFFLHDEEDVQNALESFEQLTELVSNNQIPEYDQTRYDDLLIDLDTRLQADLKAARDTRKLDCAVLIRRFRAAQQKSRVSVEHGP
ncbi:protein of unknown function [Taphrina deformans PYCC 5710]|uniref:Conserved oligomeric Golgi complex subunit 2 n=1 Tax=Taphrina deformans (strain PYCC 5710 / ATCC 11124 / CBS 356.35 / IMI 108563 / JCM 9778 / NBRC 8474) TaxID=1097556 RepID=R4XBT4_TAPDE|nr:protein of unknown function [Taphrina deformans PYCC 5710]|eukprot:CCG83325.1 protein of unknown function [Taphrina deformans PYCC 5710]